MLVVSPDSLKSEIFSISHNHFTAGHFGSFKTHKRILFTFWWPGSYQYVVENIQNCDVCCKVKALGRKRANMGIRDWPTKPLDLVSIDYLTDLPPSSNRNIHLLVVNDQFSKFMQVYPLKDRTAETASKSIYDYFLRFGSPRKLYSDRDPSYEADLFQHLMKLLGVKKLRATGYNPQANGLTEQSMPTCKNYLTSFVNSNPRNWDKYCRELCFAYNTSVHSSTGFTPAQLFFGRQINVPLDLVYGSFKDDYKIGSFSEFQENIYNLYELARNTMKTRQAVSATYYDKKVCDDKFEVGDYVYVYLPRNKRIKLALKWMGPFKIISCQHPAYEVAITNHDKVNNKWFVRNHLKRSHKSQHSLEESINAHDMNDKSDKVVHINEESINAPYENDDNDYSSSSDEEEDKLPQRKQYNLRPRAQRYVFNCIEVM